MIQVLYFSQALDNYLAIAILRTKKPLDTSHIKGVLEENLPRSPYPKVPGKKIIGFDNILKMDPTDPEGSPVPNEPLTAATRRGNKIVFGQNPIKNSEEEVRGVYRYEKCGYATTDIVFKSNFWNGFLVDLTETRSPWTLLLCLLFR